MKQLFIYCLGLFLMLSCFSACQNTKRQFEKLAQQIELSKSEIINDFSADSTLEKAWQNGQILQQELVLLKEQIFQQKSDLPYFTLEQQLTEHLADLQQLQSDASIYNLGGHLKVALSEPQQNLKTKLRTCDSILQSSQNYYSSAKLKLDQPNPERLKLAIRKQALGIYFLNGPLQDSLANLGLDTSETWQAKTSFAQRAIKDYLAWCNSQLIDYHSIENSMSDE